MNQLIWNLDGDYVTRYSNSAKFGEDRFNAPHMVVKYRPTGRVPFYIIIIFVFIFLDTYTACRLTREPILTHV